VTKTIRQADSLSDSEKQQLFGWGDDIFGGDSLKLEWRPKELHFMLEVAGVMVSHVGVLRHEVSVAGKSVMVGGVGGVVTVPEWQRRGYARELMQHTVNFFAEWKVDAGLLFCFPRRVKFYESQGWRILAQPVMVEQPAGEIVSPLGVMVFPLAGYSWPDGEVKLNSLPW